MLFIGPTKQHGLPVELRGDIAVGDYSESFVKVRSLAGGQRLCYVVQVISELCEQFFLREGFGAHCGLRAKRAEIDVY
jgi:hypothetical protein